MKNDRIKIGIDCYIIILIHFLCMEGDVHHGRIRRLMPIVSIHILQQRGILTGYLLISAYVLCMKDDIFIFRKYRIRRCNLNLHPPRGGRRVWWSLLGQCWDISIHTLRMEGDFGIKPTRLRKSDFNPRHILRMEDDERGDHFWDSAEIFQPTSSVWRTALALNQRAYANPISIHVTSCAWRAAIWLFFI